MNDDPEMKHGEDGHDAVPAVRNGVSS